VSPSKKVNPAKKGLRAVKAKGKSAKRKAASVHASKPLPVFPSSSTPKQNASTPLLHILAILAVIGITMYVYSIRDQVEKFAEYGYFGAFIIMLIANATVILPAPGLAVIFAMGGLLNPLGVALAGGAGGALGELTGYLAGYGGQAVVENSQTYKRILPWVQKYGAWVILVLSAVPNPFFDMAGIAAGISRIPVWKFLLACWVGVTIKTLMFAYAGAYSIDWIAGFYE
jgi:uncharacterized membrane protein YdjX (TVP38/TMEM64 family)